MSFRSKNRKKALGNKKKKPKRDEWQQDVTDKTSGVKWLSEIVMENELFEKFYREIVPADEFDAFLAALKSPLPIVFRTNPSSIYAPFVGAEIEAQFPNGDAVQVGEEMVHPPRELDWFPGVWQFKASRKETRSEPKLANFKQWLVGAAEAGQVVRQEAVSMIPPVLLDVHDGHMVLDACAAPGSKTTQLLEAIHENGIVSTGCVVANELNENRARMLTHRLKAITSANLLITNHDARMFPRINLGIDLETTQGGVPLDFDRILCDVPCTGDGTLRKAVDIWKRWSPEMARGIHQMQLLISQRATRMLKEGGRMVYSTCSMNPMEDEAVVAELLRGAQGALRLVDCSEMLPRFRRLEGRSSWRIMGKDGEFIEPTHSDAATYQSSMWPPTAEEAETFHLERCWRILPHHQDTGGFFCAVIEKVSALPGAPKRAKVAEEAEEEDAPANSNEKNEEAVPLNDGKQAETTALVASDDKGKEEATGEKAAAGRDRKKRVRRNYESPYIMVDPASEIGALIQQGIEYFGLDLDPRRFMVRNEESQKIFFYVGGPIPDILPMDTVGRLHVMSAGTRIFIKHKRTGGPFAFRLASEACQLLAVCMRKRNILIPLDDAAKLVASDSVVLAELGEGLRQELAGLQPGSLICRIQCDAHEIPVLGWLAAASFQFQIPKENRPFVSKVVQDLFARRSEQQKKQ